MMSFTATFSANNLLFESHCGKMACAECVTYVGHNSVAKFLRYVNVL